MHFSSLISVFNLIKVYLQSFRVSINTQARAIPPPNPFLMSPPGTQLSLKVGAGYALRVLCEMQLHFREGEIIHLKYFTMCSNYSILFNQILVKLHFITHLTAFKYHAFVISHFIQRVGRVYKLRKSVDCIFKSALIFD